MPQRNRNDVIRSSFRRR